WPATDGETVWLPRGRHRVETAQTRPPARALRFNGELLDARTEGSRVEVEYHSSARALCLLDRPPAAIEIDGRAIEPEVFAAGDHWTVRLPAGRHTARIRF